MFKELTRWLNSQTKSLRPRLRQSAGTSTNHSLLESREYLAVTSALLSGTTLKIQSDNVATKVLVTGNSSSVTVYDQVKNVSWNFAGVQTIEFKGGTGNDQFVNQASNVKSLGYGFAGNDKLVGSNADDTLYGGDGNDIILGGIGNDFLYGDAGNDQLNGQAGTDSLFGGLGDDTIIAIDNGQSDKIQSDAGNDIIWVDKSGTATDSMISNTSTDFVQSIASFSNTADKTLDGDNLVDPTIMSGASYRNFAGYSLFASTGPSINDIKQGSLGDCYFLGGLAAIAQDTPNAILKNMVDFNDGTFGIRLGNNYYRVDADLPVYTGSASLAYAKLGAQNSLWVAVAEKAFAHYRKNTNSYASLEGGWGIEVNRAFRSVSLGDFAFSSFKSAADLGNAVYGAWAAKKAVTIGIISNTNASIVGNLINSHLYTVVSVTKDSKGVVTSMVLRNPWGVDGAGNDANKNDGLVTVTPTQLFGIKGYSRVQWGAVS